MINFFANIFGYVLNFLYNLVGNYGLAIILFSLFLRILVLPVTISQQKSMDKSSKMQAELNKLQVKYKGNPEELNKATMELYKKEKFNPASGCLSSILVLIIFVTVFYVVRSPLTYMRKVDKDTIQNYTNQVVEEAKSEGKNVSYPEMEIISRFEKEDERVNINMNFLGLNLSDVPSRNYKDVKSLIIPILYVASTFLSMQVSTRLNMTEEQKEKERKRKEIEKLRKAQAKDPTTKQIMETTESAEDQMEDMAQLTKNMNMMMPIISISIAIVAPLGLSLYWLTSNILQLAERFFMKGIEKAKSKKEANA